MTFLYILAVSVQLLLSLLSLALLARAILSLFMFEGEGFFSAVLMGITEPFLTPIRAFMSIFPFANQSPFDFSFIALVIIVYLLQLFLPTPIL